MTRRRRALLAAALLPAVLGLGAGCQLGQDDELARPTRTVTASPSPEAAPAPQQVPVGAGPVSASDVVWGDGQRLHVGRRSVDLSPASIEQLVAVPGGVYVLSDGELWFTDLQRLRGTGLTDVTRVALSGDGEQLLVTTGSGTGPGKAVVHGYDVRTGRRADVSGTPAARPVPEAPETAGFRGYPADFTLAGWAGGSTFYGVAREDGAQASVVACRVTTRTCATLGSVQGTDPLVFPHPA